MKRWIAIGALLAAGVGIWLWWGSDRRRIDRRLARLERVCEKSGSEGEGALDLIGRGEAILDAFAPGFVVTAHPYEGTLTDGRQLVGAIETYRRRCERVRVHDGEEKLTISDHGTAEMDVLFAVDCRRGGGPSGSGARFRAHLFWVDTDQGWKIRDFEIVKVLEDRGLFR